ncbi:phosphoenolpyruvate--protein phosphotransferase [Novispirillum sp. DQ9]|uniref:phosphoenolpyruvate--protein phosphotransferase n=1 Tax=Novispirillum sp. DQ9 TaxID=3398612 RepID=UPI003C7E2710
MKQTRPPRPADAPEAPQPVPATEQVFEGVGVGPGIAIGFVHLHDAGMVSAPEYRIPASRVAAEQRRFAQAVAAARKQMAALRQKARRLPAAAGEELGYLLEAYDQMLKGSRLIRGVEHRIETERVNAEAAVRREIEQLVAAFALMGDAYLAGRMVDVREIGQRLVRNLTKTPARPFEDLPRNAVIISHELTPADTALLDPHHVGGFATQAGGAESHTAIMARSLSLPAVIGVPALLRVARSGDPVVVDGVTGRVILHPSTETLAEYRRKRADFLRARRALGRLRDLPAVTTDGERLGLLANIELPTEIEAVLNAGAEGIGLLRSEFLYMNRVDWPDEEEQYAIFREVVERMAGRPVTIRTLDAGGDKLETTLGASMPANPALGLRAVRFLLSRPDVLEAQLAAILRAAAHGPVRILLPMVTTTEEVLAVRAIAETVHARLRTAGVTVAAKMPPIGAMIEIPGAALSADALAGVSDFFAIGTNDLTQYTLAIDRADDAVAHLYNPLHPAVLRLIHFTTGAAVRAGIPVSLCGEMAGDPRLSGLLLGLGIRELSMSASNIPRVKHRIRRLSMAAAQTHACQVMSEHDGRRIGELISAF